MLGVVSCPNLAGANFHMTSITSALGCIMRRGEMTYGAARFLADERVQYWNASGGWGWGKHGAVRQTECICACVCVASSATRTGPHACPREESRTNPCCQAATRIAPRRKYSV